MAARCSLVRLYYCIIWSPRDGHLGGFQAFAVTSSASANNLYRASFLTGGIRCTFPVGKSTYDPIRGQTASVKVAPTVTPCICFPTTVTAQCGIKLWDLKISDR